MGREFNLSSFSSSSSSSKQKRIEEEDENDDEDESLTPASQSFARSKKNYATELMPQFRFPPDNDRSLKQPEE